MKNFFTIKGISLGFGLSVASLLFFIVSRFSPAYGGAMIMWTLAKFGLGLGSKVGIVNLVILAYLNSLACELVLYKIVYEYK